MGLHCLPVCPKIFEVFMIYSFKSSGFPLYGVFVFAFRFVIVSYANELIYY